MRVESSKKRLTTVRPRSVGSFLTSRPASACVDLRGGVEHQGRVGAVEVGRLQQVPLHLIVPLGDAATSSVPSISARCTFTCCVREVGTFLPTKSARIGSSRWPRSTSTASCTAAGPAEVAQRVERGADRAAGEEDVVDEDDEPAVDAAVGQHRGLQRPDAAQPQVVAVEGDVDGADVDLRAGERLDAGGEAAGQRGAAGRDADEDEGGEAAVR